MAVPKIEIHQVNGKQGIFTEIVVDGHVLHGVRRFELKQEVGNSIPTLSLDLNALDMSINLQALHVNQKGYDEIESIKFKRHKSPVEFGEKE